MGVDSLNRVGSQTGAVFVSYASQDADAAQRICAALRDAGIEVWFDQSELRGGEAWDRQIRKQIHDCALFVPVISAHSDARREGYFRREWKLAVDRTADMAEDVPFLLPVVIDSTPDATARVPDRFREVQWSRLPDGQASPAFIERVQRLLTPARDQAPAARVAAPSVPDAALRARRPVRGLSWSKPVVWVIVAVVAFAVLGYFVAEKFWISKHAGSPPTPPAAPTGVAPAAFAPPQHSIAVLPFVNLSGDASQDYFSDGLTEELLNSLAEIEGLQVAARTSSFSFKEHPDIATVAHKLNVGAVLEGSVRRSAHTVRVTAQLINAVTGFHLWSKTYDRDLGDVLKLQTEIATAVAGSLKITLLGDLGAKIELGGTRTAVAFDVYLRASNAYWAAHSVNNAQAAIDAYSEAIRLDPNYALAYTGRSLALGTFATNWATGPAIRAGIDNARADALKALALAPELAEAHLALAANYQESLEFPGATAEYERALALGPGNARLLRNHGAFAIYMGHQESGLAALRRAVALDSLNSNSYIFLGDGLRASGRYNEALAAYMSAEALEPDNPYVGADIGILHYLLGDPQGARASCESKAEAVDYGQFCLAMTYHRLGRFADAERMLTRIRASDGDSGAYYYTGIYSQRGNTRIALDWLETAMRLRVPDLVRIKTSPLLEPLRNEPRFRAIERELKFPD